MELIQQPYQRTYRRNRDQITAWVDPRYQLKERLRRLKEKNPRLSESRITEDALLFYLPHIEKILSAAVLLVMLTLAPAFAETAFLWSNGEPMGMIQQAGPNSPALYWGNDGTMGLTTPAGRNSLWWMQNADGGLDTGFIQGLPAIPAPALPALTYEELRAKGMDDNYCMPRFKRKGLC